MFFIIAYSLTNIANESVYEQANATAWKAIQAKETMKGSRHVVDAKSIKDRVEKLIESGKFKANKAIATDISTKARISTLNALNAIPSGDIDTAINRIMTPNKIFVFISKSMPRGQILSLLKSLEKTDLDVEVAYRGLFEGNRTIMDAFKQSGMMLTDLGIKKLAAEFNMNPTAFREANISAVPTMVYVHENRRLSRITGSVNVRSFYESVTDIPKDFGNEGAVFEIEEKDFFVEIQERMAKIDWPQKVEQAKKAYWDNIMSYKIPVSTKYEFFEVDMTNIVNRDIYAEYDGEKHIIAKAGDRFNSLDRPEMAQFNRVMLIFNPNDKKQSDWAQKQVNSALAMNERPVIMLTELLSSHQENTFSILEERYRMPIYLLQDKVVMRFNISKIPASIKRASNYSGSMRVTYFSCDNRRNTCGD